MDSNSRRTLAAPFRRQTMIWIPIIAVGSLLGALGFTIYMLDRESRRGS